MVFFLPADAFLPSILTFHLLNIPMKSMTFFRLLALILFVVSCVSAHAATDEDRYLLTVSNLEKIKAVDAELKKTKGKKAKKTSGDDDDEADDPKDKGNGKKKEKSAAEMARELDADPQIRAALARHGISSMDVALTTRAAFAAGFYLMFEPSMDKSKASALYSSYTKEQQANIELLRKNKNLLGK